MNLNYDRATRAAIDRAWSPPVKDWREAVTVGTTGELGRAPIVGETVSIVIPDDYLGDFEVHLIADDGTRALLVEGRRLPELEEL